MDIIIAAVIGAVAGITLLYIADKKLK